MFSKFVVSINLPSTHVVCPGLIKSGNTFYSVTARAFDIIFWSTFKREIGLQF